MKKKTTKELLADSFLELAEKIPINKITIANIVDNCDVTQPTFYRYFKDKYDMIAWIYAQETGKNISKVGRNGYVFKDTFLDGMRFYDENRKFMVNALKHTSGRDSFLFQMSDMNIRFIENEIKKKLNVSECPQDLAAVVKMFCYGTNQFLYDWLIEKNDLTYEQVAKLMEESIPEVLRPYICE
ncbi:MAG: TetR/AcrR family transcriptional regulator C-terminal domain-containing protein [Lachnospiraceae bacterium]|nr:TetR/AcrR family transcriptional regulator C-terminal domain-containing protein [Lachnospiraceae bacterium]